MCTIVTIFSALLFTENSAVVISIYNADQFVKKHELSGLCTGMFISELGEADYWRFQGIDQEMIDQSNERFSFIVSKYIDKPIEFLHTKLLKEYELLATTNSIARFNLQRIQLAYSGTIERPLKVVTNDI